MFPDKGIVMALASNINVTSVGTSFNLMGAFIDVSPNYVNYTTIKSKTLKKGWTLTKENPRCGLKTGPFSI